MIELHTPRGLAVAVPETEAEDSSPKFDWLQHESIARYYRDNGYVIVRDALPAETCDTVRSLWDCEIKPSRDFIYRQATAKAERHVLNARGWVMNPILNLQSVDPLRYPQFRAFATEQVLTAPRLINIFTTLLGERPKIVQSMYFEGNSVTWEHQDSYYLDSEHVGSMAGAWIAIEDIAATAGRFFICPRSHQIDLGRQGVHNNIADNHEVYIQSVVEKIKQLGLTIRAPCLRKGDVLLWNSWTIHGSLDSQDPLHARSSITCHAIPDSHRFLSLQSRIKPLKIRLVNDVRVHCPKDLARPFDRSVFFIETHFPNAFYRVKKVGIRSLFRLRAAH
jgi:phytanoyl-CoA hydroxylase